MSYFNNDLFDPLSVFTSNHEGGPLDDCFDFALGDSLRIFTGSTRSLDVDQLSSIFDSATSVDIDRMFEDDSPMEFDSMCFESVRESEPQPQQKVQTAKTDYICVRRSHSQPQSVQEVKNFDPAPYDHEKYQKMMKRSSCNDLKVLMEATAAAPSNEFSSLSKNALPQRRATMDCSTMSLQHRVALDSAMPSSLNQLFGNRMNRQECSTSENSSQYHNGLQKLAESMKRTELSRRQLIMQRTINLPCQQQVAVAREAQSHIHQQVAINLTQQQLHHRVAISVSSDSFCMVDQQNHVMEAFFSGSRSAVTNGLEQSAGS